MKQSAKLNVRRPAVGTAAAMTAYLALLALLALAVEQGKVDEGAVAAVAGVITILSVFVGAKIAAYQDAEPMRAAALCAAGFCTAVLLAGFFVNDGLEPKRSGVLALCAAAGAACAMLTGKRSAKRKRRSRK